MENLPDNSPYTASVEENAENTNAAEEKEAPEDTTQEITPGERLKGVVSFYNGQRGFGFIQREGTTEKSERIFVHWDEIVSADNYPLLKKGQDVEYELGVSKSGKGDKLAACRVTAPGGEPVTMENEEAVAHSEESYTGTVKFYNARKGFGFIQPDEETITYEEATANKSEGIYVSRMNIISDDKAHRLNREYSVRFYVVKSKRGLAAVKVTQPDGQPCSYTPHERKPKKRKLEDGGDGNPAKKAKKEYEEEERDFDDRTHEGNVTFYNIGRGFGWIKGKDGVIDFKESGELTEEGGIYFHRKHVTTDIQGPLKIQKGTAVSFRLYKSHKGFGAAEVLATDPERPFEEAPKREKRSHRKKKPSLPTKQAQEEDAPEQAENP